MDSVFDRVSSIQSGREAWRVKVRIVRLWSVPSYMNPERINSLEMVLVDESGAKIQASVRRSLMYIFERRLTEGSVYKMCFFTVVHNTGSYRATAHEFQLLFQIKTKVTQAESTTIPIYGLSFVDSDEIYKHRVDSDFLVDFIGLITAVSGERECIKDGKITKMIVMELTDHKGRVECALFGDYVDELNGYMSNCAEEIPIVIVQFAKIKNFKGNAVIQNVMKTSRILFNAPIAEGVEFRNSLALHGVEADQPMGVIGDGGKVSREDEFLNIHPKKTIAELHQSDEDGMFIVGAKVTGFVEGVEWWYPACRCHRAVTPDFGVYYCGGCYKHVLQIIPRFRIRLDVDDGTETAVFVIFDNDVQCLTKKSCLELVSNAKLGPAAPCPKELEVMIGKEMLFKVEKKTDVGSCFDVSYRVKKVCDEESIMNLFHNGGRTFTPEKPPFPGVVSLDDDEDTLGNSGGSGFVSSITVSPCSTGSAGCSQILELGPAKRKLVAEFDDEVDLDFNMPLKEVKIEKN